MVSEGFFFINTDVQRCSSVGKCSCLLPLRMRRARERGQGMRSRGRAAVGCVKTNVGVCMCMRDFWQHCHLNSSSGTEPRFTAGLQLKTNYYLRDQRRSAMSQLGTANWNVTWQACHNLRCNGAGIWSELCWASGVSAEARHAKVMSKSRLRRSCQRLRHLPIIIKPRSVWFAFIRPCVCVYGWQRRCKTSTLQVTFVVLLTVMFCVSRLALTPHETQIGL